MELPARSILRGIERKNMYQDQQAYTLGPAALGGVKARGGYESAMTAANMAQEPSAIRMPEVVSEKDRLNKAVELLGMTADKLLCRLAPVRNQSSPVNGCEATSAPDAVLCPIADRVRHVRRSIEDVQGMLQRALNELEI